MVIQLLQRFFLWTLQPLSTRAERKALGGLTAGIGLADEEMNLPVLTDHVHTLKDALKRRNITLVDISDIQSDWLLIPLDSGEQRPAYTAHGAGKFPDAHFYIVFSVECLDQAGNPLPEDESYVVFTVFGHSFTPLYRAEVPLTTMLTSQTFGHYLGKTFSANLALLKSQHPKAFQPGLWLGPPRGEISKVFTLPPLR